jgi:CheY-like chemotaxis protein
MKKVTHAVLLVEDSQADVKITQRAWQESGISADLLIVRDGQEALDYLLRQKKHATDPTWRAPDLVLLDLNLPRLSGQEVLRRLRATASLPPLPVIVLSTSKRPEEVRELYAAGANTYIEKPRDFARFVRVLQTILHYWLDLALLPSEPC